MGLEDNLLAEARARRERLDHPPGSHSSSELSIRSEPASRALAIARIEAEAEQRRPMRSPPRATGCGLSTTSISSAGASTNRTGGRKLRRSRRPCAVTTASAGPTCCRAAGTVTSSGRARWRCIWRGSSRPGRFPSSAVGLAGATTRRYFTPSTGSACCCRPTRARRRPRRHPPVAGGDMTIRTPNLTRAMTPKVDNAIDRTVPGMAHFACTGPFGRTCGDCAFLGYRRAAAGPSDERGRKVPAARRAPAGARNFAASPAGTARRCRRRRPPAGISMRKRREHDQGVDAVLCRRLRRDTLDSDS